MEQVWALSTGSYSDYRVQAVFASKKEAERAKVLRVGAGQYGDEARVEPLFFFPEGSPEPVRIAINYHNITLWDDGTQDDDRCSVREEWEYDPWDSRYMSDRPYVRFIRAPVHKDAGGRLEVYGTNEKACLKTISDYVAQWKAQGHRLNEMNK